MFRSVLTKTLHDYNRTLAFWGIGLLLLAAMMMSVYPSVKDSAPQLATYIENMPEAFKAMFGLQGMDYTSPAGYLNTELFSMMLPIAFAAFAIGVGSRAVAGEEDRKTLDLLLSTPTTRGTVLAHKFGAMIVDMAALTAALWVSLWLFGALFGFGMGPGRLLEASINCGLLGLTFGSVALLIGSAKGGRAFSIAVTSALLVAVFLLQSLSQIVSWLEPYRVLSPFYWYSRSDVLRNGVAAVDMAVLVGVTLVFGWLSLLAFDRRDLRA